MLDVRIICIGVSLGFFTVVVKEVEEGSWKGRKGCGDEDREREVI